jgi:hypothetical protein
VKGQITAFGRKVFSVVENEIHRENPPSMPCEKENPGSGDTQGLVEAMVL